MDTKWIAFAVFLAVVALLILATSSSDARAEETHYVSPRGASLPNCPKLPAIEDLPRLVADEPDRYAMGPYTYGDVKQPKRCIEIIDKQQTGAWGRNCRVALDCDT